METTDTTPVEQKPAVNFWEKCKRLAKKITGIFSKKPPAPAPPLPPEPVPESIKQLYKNLEQELQYNKSLLLPQMELDFLYAVRSMIDTGIENGIHGIPGARNNEIAIIAENKANSLFTQATVMLAGISAKAETEEQEKSQLMNRSKQQDMQQHQYLELLQYYRRHHARSFSWPWGVLCLITGVILLCADFPLSLKLFQKGFDFRHWESWPPAIGISLCTIFIKIYYDNYIDLKHGNGLIINARFAEMFAAGKDKDDQLLEESFTSKNQKELKIKRNWYNFILGFIIVGIIILGVFRAEAMNNKSSSTFDYIVNLATFIFLTLIFPIISGICLSIGFTIWQNRMRFKETNGKCKRSEKKYIESLKAYTAIRKERADVQSEIEKWQNGNVVESYKATLLSYYDVGYKYGAFNPDIGKRDKDMFQLADGWRNKAVARKTNNHIIKISGL